MSKHIALISDTHAFLGDDVMTVLQTCDEIWHAGDVGDYRIIDKLESTGASLRLVYGNIDGFDIRTSWPKEIVFHCEGIKVYMTHIGGYPERYTSHVREVLEREQPDLYVCGHSHILKVVRDKRLNILHMNPGSCGHHGLHFVRTILTFEIDQAQIKNVQVVEFGKRGRLT